MNQTQEILEFGIKRENEERRDGGCAVVFDPVSQKYAVGSHDNRGAYSLFSGGVDDGEDMEAGVLREVREESGLHNFLHIEKIAEAITHYYNNRKNVNRVAHATCFLVILKNRDLIPTKLEPHEKFILLWKSADEILKTWESRNQDEDYSHWLYFMEKAKARLAELGYKEA